jgi:hypothetical protein
MQSANAREDYRTLAKVILAAGVLWGLYIHWLLWQVDLTGVSPISEKLPYWDFSNLWAGGRLALLGDVDTLFDVETYRAVLRAWYAPEIADQEWSYPPSILLIGAPLSILPLPVAYLLWTFGSIGGLYWACRACGIAKRYSIFVCLSPVVFFNALFGQNGTLCAALMIAGLALVDRRPVLSGVLIGLLSIKPHLGILLPFCLLAGGYRIPFVTAAVTCIALILATGLLFGFSTWLGFFSVTRPLMTEILEAPFPQGYQANAATLFAYIRSIGGGLSTAYVFQIAAAVLAIAISVGLWRHKNSVDRRFLIISTATLTLIATPYGYLYDAVPVAAGAVLLFSERERFSAPLLYGVAALWFMPVLSRYLLFLGFNTGVFFIFGVVALLFFAFIRRPVSMVSPEASIKAS